MLCGARLSAWEWAGVAACQGPALGSGDASRGAKRSLAVSIVEAQPPVNSSQRQIISFAKTPAFPPPETQGEMGAKGESETGAQ